MPNKVLYCRMSGSMTLMSHLKTTLATANTYLLNRRSSWPSQGPNEYDYSRL